MLTLVQPLLLNSTSLVLRRLLSSWKGSIRGGREVVMPGSTSQPGFLTVAGMEELQRTPKPLPQILQTILPNLPGSSRNSHSSTFLPSLTDIRNVEEAQAAVFRHTNQEPICVMRLLRIATQPNLLSRELEGMGLNQLARNILSEALDEDGDDAASSFLLDDGGNADGDGENTGALGDHIECSRVLKKRRRRMRRHKHKKRLRENRYKNKK